MGNLQFDATTVSPNTAFDPLPDCWYAMRIVGSDMQESETAGQMLKLELEIDENHHPEFANRKVFDRLCLNHPTSQKAREIAQRTLSAICHSIGKLQIADSDELLGHSVLVKVKAVPARTDEKTNKTYDAGNEVRGYKALDGSQPATAAATKPAAAAAPAAAPAQAPWKKPK